MNRWPVTFSLPLGFAVGGLNTWALRFAAALAESNWDVRLVAHDPPAGYEEGNLSRRTSLGKVPILRAPGFGEADAWRRSLAIYRRLLPTVLLPNVSAESYAIAAALTSECPEKVRTVGWCHGDGPEDFALPTYYEPAFHRFVAISRRTHRELSARLPNRRGHIRHIPHGVPIGKCAERPPLADRPIRLMYAGRMEQAIKRIFDVVALADTLDRRGLRFEIRMIGDGPHGEALDRRIACVQSSFSDPRNQISREPPVSHEAMASLWRWADVSILTSRREAFGLSALEAMSHGCIPVITDVGSGIGEFLSHGENGFLFPIGDIDAAADSIAGLRSNKGRMRHIARSAWQTAADHCGYELFLERAVSVIGEAMTAPPRTWPIEKPTMIPDCREPSGAFGIADDSDRFDHVLEFLDMRRDARQVVVYGLGANGSTLIERLRTEPIMQTRRLFAADDGASEALLRSVHLPCLRPKTWRTWPDGTVVIVTPNDFEAMRERLILCGGREGVDFLTAAAPRVTNGKETATPLAEERICV